ncbi:DinB family protein [Flavobacterium selenitireducens]|uniref:DinB family protein n=1 Tax=Flavobacterium selenitireducens TaxID=2722704 RepID=UPI00168BB4B5|nr:DinB family protein [Flavobacterium selenitireducens]MBD3582144.1 damage-inducible protein DinB [Flavobacterium selenitireducens]
METTATTTMPIISKDELLKHYFGHRFLTRRTIELFPEKEFFEFSIGGMRTAAQLANELLSIAGPALKAIANSDDVPYIEPSVPASKAEYLKKWDEADEEIKTYWAQIPEERFPEMFNLFGQYNFPILHNVLYFIDNEIHHRGQMFVYLRALNIEPPFFWERW